MIIEEDDFLEHHGVKGMRWGQRHAKRVARVQKRIDRTQRLATGKASFKDRALGSSFTAKGAQKQLQRGANAQAKVQAKLDAGKFQTRMKILKKIGAVNITEVNFHAKGDAKAKLDRGQKAAIAAVAAIGAIQVASLVANRR